MANLSARMQENVIGHSPRLQTSDSLNLPSVSNLSTEPLKVVVKKATEWMDVCTSKGVKVTSHSCVVGMSL